MADEYPSKVYEPGMGWVGFGIIIYLLDFVTKFKGIDRDVFLSLLGTKAAWLNGFVIITLTVLIILQSRKEESTKEQIMQYFTFYLLVVFVTVTLSMGGFAIWAGWNGPIIHLIFAGFFLVKVLYNKGYTKTQANFLILFLLLVDFFGFSLGNWNKLLAPVWFFAAIYFTKPSKLKSWLVFIVILFYLFHFAGSLVMYGGKQEMLNGKDFSELKNFASTSWNNFKQFTLGIKNEAYETKNRTQAMVFRDYYTSEVDDNVQQPLGVSIIEIKSSNPNIYEDEPFVMFARIQARTLKDEIKIKNFCHADSVLPDSIKPQTYTITQYEDMTIDCMFNSCRFSPGPKTIYFNINFDFQTMSYLRNYFIDRERMQTMIMEDETITTSSDILTKYGISNTNPIALSTNGPMKIGIEVEQTQPVSIDRERESLSFRLGITLENNWDGKINDVKSLAVILPNEMNLELDGGTKGTYCGGYNFEPKICADIFGKDAGDWCDDSMSNIYAINQDGNNQNIITPGQPGISSYKSLICRMSLIKSDYGNFLGTAPIAIKNFKVISKYDYELQKSSSVNIQKSPYDGCKGKVTSEDIKEVECKGFTPDKSNLPASDYQERYKRYQNTVQSLVKAYKPSSLNEVKAEALLAAIMSDVSRMGDVDKNENKIEDYVAGSALKFSDIYLDSPNQDIEAAAKNLKKYIDEATETKEEDKIKSGLEEYKTNNGLEDIMDKDKVMAYYIQWQNRLCKGEETGSGNGQSPAEEVSIPFATLFKKNDMIGVDSNSDGIWTLDDSYFFITGFKQGSDSRWVYTLNASKITFLNQMKIDAFDYQRNIEASSKKVMVQRPATKPAQWSSISFSPNMELKHGAVA